MRKSWSPEVAGMKKLVIAGGLIAVTQIADAAGGFAGPWEDGLAACNRGDYAPAMRAQEMMQACEASNYRSCEY
jgi:hypothetical protein